MSKERTSWRSPRMGGREITLVRYGDVGLPLLIYPTAGGDAEEAERFHLIEAIGDLLAESKIKAYSVDSLAGKSWFTECQSIAQAAHVQNQFDACIYHEVVPAIRQDCRDPNAEIVVAGASIGAFNALASLCRHPDAFRTAICMSGTYDVRKFIDGEANHEYHECSPLSFVPALSEGPHLDALRKRYVLLAHGKGRWEEPGQDWGVADALGSRGVPNRVDAWGEEWDHDWVTWREMLPHYLRELTAG